MGQVMNQWEWSCILCVPGHGIKIPEGFENIALWKNVEVMKIPDTSAVEYIQLEMLIFKSMHSDQYWCASGKQVFDKNLFSPQLVKNALDIYSKIGEFTLMSEVKDEINTLSTKILNEVSLKNE